MILSLSNLPHALLLIGKTDLLKPTLEYDLKILLCENSETQACGTCPSCQLFASEAGHPDLIWVMPEGKLNVIKIDNVRAVINFLEQSSLRGGKRIVVFNEADTLNIASQNALLKSLEEPGDQTLIILISAKAHLLLPTIRSRCQTLQSDQKNRGENKDLAQALLSSNFDPLPFIETYKELDLLECVHTQMQLIYTLMQANPHSALSQFYRDLVQKSALFQKKVAVNTELALFELALAWKQLITDNARR